MKKVEKLRKIWQSLSQDQEGKEDLVHLARGSSLSKQFQRRSRPDRPRRHRDVNSIQV